jgi:hypothetical protein
MECNIVCSSVSILSFTSLCFEMVIQQILGLEFAAASNWADTHPLVVYLRQEHREASALFPLGA